MRTHTADHCTVLGERTPQKSESACPGSDARHCLGAWPRAITVFHPVIWLPSGDRGSLPLSG